MRLHEVFHPELNLNIRYRVLTAGEIDLLLLEYGDEGREQFMQVVLESVIHNLRTEVTSSLRKLPKDRGKAVVNSLFIGALMINPGLDSDSWVQISKSPTLNNAATVGMVSAPEARKPRSRKIMSRSKFLNLERHLKDRVIGQDESIEELVWALKRAQAGLSDERRPLGVFLCAGASGVGKTLVAKELHKYLFGEDYDIVRIDCGEYQQKHENQKLIGAAPGYMGYDEGGRLTNSIIKHPQTVVLLDEIEKAHPDLWDTFLRVFDEGILTSSRGEEADFKDTIIIMTTNLGNSDIVHDLTDRKIGFGSKNESFPNRERVIRLAQESIKKKFRPELLNRIDKTLIFNHLEESDYLKIAELELNHIQSKLEKRGFTLVFDDAVLGAMVHDGVNHVQGARGLAQLRRDRIENSLADLMLLRSHPKGTVFKVSFEADDYRVSVQRPVSRSARSQSVLLADSDPS